MIAMLCSYLLSLRLSGVLEVDTSVGRRCSSFVGEDLLVRFMCWGLAMGNKPIHDCSFFLFGTRESQTPYCCYDVLLVPVGGATHCFRLFCMCSRVVSLFSPRFVSLSFQNYFLGLLKSAWSWRCGGETLLGEGYAGRASGSQCCGGSPLFPVLSYVMVGHWVIGRPRNESGGSLLEVPLCYSLGFRVLALPVVHSAQ